MTSSMMVPVRSTLTLLCLAAFAGCSDTTRIAELQPLELRLNHTQLVLQPGGTARLSPVDGIGSLPAGARVSWSTSDARVAQVDQTGTVRGVDAGDALVTLSVTYNLKTDKVSANVKVNPGPSKLTLLGGSGQSGQVATTLPEPVRVSVTEPSGKVVADVAVTFTARNASGAVYATTTVPTDSSGVAAHVWTLGTTTGAHTLTASVDAPSAPTAEATAQAQAGPAARLEVVSGDRQSGTIGEPLPVSIVVRSVDSFGNAVAGTAVTWLAEFESGTVGPSPVSTDASGQASATWRLGTRLGEQSVTGSSSSGVVRFTATGNRPTTERMSVTGASALTALGQTAQLTATAYSASGAVITGIEPTWVSLQPAIVTVTQSGLITAVANGTARVYASMDGVADTVTITMQQKVASLTLVPATVTLAEPGLSTQLVVSAQDANGHNIANLQPSWSSSAPAVATVSAGLVTGVAAGSARITATADGVAAYSDVTVNEKPVPTTVTVTAPATSLLVGQSVQATAVVKDQNGAVIGDVDVAWSSSNAGIASVSGSGVVKGVAAGSATITATAGDRSGSLTFTVEGGAAAVASVTLSPSSATLNAIGAQATFTATLRDAAGNQITDVSAAFSSLDAGIASVTSAGVVTAHAPGKARIVATAGSAADTAVVTVSQAPASIAIAPTSMSIVVGSTLQASATVSDANGYPIAGASVSWSSLATGIATVSSSGLVSAIAEGSTKVRATSGSLSADAAVSVTGQTTSPPSVTSVVVSPESDTIRAVGGTRTLTATAYDNTTVLSDASFVWTSLDPDLAVVSQSGEVLAIMNGTARIVASSGAPADTASIVVKAAETDPTVTKVVASPETDTIKAIGFTAQFTATGYDAQGSVVSTAVAWTSLNPAVATISTEGIVTAKSVGTALLVAAASGCAGCTSDTIAAVVRQDPASVELSAATVSLNVGATQQVSATVMDAAGVAIPDSPVQWTASPSSIIAVSSTGEITALAEGSGLVIATSGGQYGDTVGVTVKSSEPPPPPPVATNGEFVVFPTPEIAFIIGPQLKSGSSANPWPWFDENAIEKGLHHGATYFDGDPQIRMYYDQVLAQYTNYYRTGDERFLNYARSLADSWYESRLAAGTGTAPRSVALGGLILRALDGRPEMWEWITTYAQYHLWNWIERRYENVELWYGVRDGAYATLYAIQVGQVHSDPAIRADLTQRSAKAVHDYWKKHQDRWGDGGWYWKIESASLGEYASQPFQVGILAEALIAHHRATNDPGTADMIADAAEWLYTKSYDKHETSNLPGVYWRAMKYFTYQHDHTINDRTTAEKYNKKDGGMRDARQLNATTAHAFGYAYKITGDTRYLQYGDDVFSATFGKGRGPGADAYWGLADYTAKEYNQSYRAAGRYLAWRAGAN
jgi:trimeric autotransporter adhesin